MKIKYKLNVNLREIFTYFSVLTSKVIDLYIDWMLYKDLTLIIIIIYIEYVFCAQIIIISFQLLTNYKLY